MITKDYHNYGTSFTFYMIETKIISTAQGANMDGVNSTHAVGSRLWRVFSSLKRKATTVPPVIS